MQGFTVAEQRSGAGCEVMNASERDSLLIKERVMYCLQTKRLSESSINKTSANVEVEPQQIIQLKEAWKQRGKLPFVDCFVVDMLVILGPTGTAEGILILIIIFSSDNKKKAGSWFVCFVNWWSFTCCVYRAQLKIWNDDCCHRVSINVNA